MALKNYYELLEIAPAAPADEVKRVPKRLRDRDRDMPEGRRQLPAANVAEFKK